MQLCMGNGLYDLPSLSSEVCVKPAEGDGFCFVYSALAATGQADSERAAKACLRRASKHLYEFVRKDVDPVSLAEDQEGMQVSIGCEVLSCSHVCMLGCPSCSTCIVCMPTDKTHVKNIYKCAQEAMRHDMLTELDDPQWAHSNALLLPGALALNTTFRMILHHASCHIRVFCQHAAGHCGSEGADDAR